MVRTLSSIVQGENISAAGSLYCRSCRNCTYITCELPEGMKTLEIFVEIKEAQVCANHTGQYSLCLWNSTTVTISESEAAHCQQPPLMEKIRQLSTLKVQMI